MSCNRLITQWFITKSQYWKSTVKVIWFNLLSANLLIQSRRAKITSFVSCSTLSSSYCMTSLLKMFPEKYIFQIACLQNFMTSRKNCRHTGPGYNTLKMFSQENNWLAFLFCFSCLGVVYRKKTLLLSNLWLIGEWMASHVPHLPAHALALHSHPLFVRCESFWPVGHLKCWCIRGLSALLYFVISTGTNPG